MKNRRMKEATVLPVKCSKTGNYFGMRVEKQQNYWVSTWAFKLDERIISVEKYDQEKVNGEIYLDPEYPGCPYCRHRSFVQCGACRKLFDWDGETKKVVCANCDRELELTGGGKFDVDGSSM